VGRFRESEGAVTEEEQKRSARLVQKLKKEHEELKALQAVVEECRALIESNRDMKEHIQSVYEKIKANVEAQS